MKTEISQDNKRLLKARVSDALGCVFELYPWEKMLDDALDKKSARWAKKNLTYAVVEKERR